MTSSTSCSSRAALAVALALAGCAHRPPAGPPLRRLAVLPPANLAGRPAPLDDVQASVERAVARAGALLAPRDRVEAFLAERRVRSTVGVSSALAQAARDELGVDGIVLTTLEQYAEDFPPAYSAALRVVEASWDAPVRFLDATARVGDDSPGAFNRGVVRDVRRLERDVTDRLGGSLRAFLERDGPAFPPCATGKTVEPRVAHARPALAGRRGGTVAVLPFLDRTPRRNAGELVALQVARELAAVGPFRPLEPGVVRDKLLGLRVTFESGVSIDVARMLGEALEVDLVVTGQVFEYRDDPSRPPGASFTLTLHDAKTGETLWESTSTATGDEGTFFFGAGAIRAAPVLACSMARGAAEGIAAGARRAR